MLRSIVFVALSLAVWKMTDSRNIRTPGQCVPYKKVTHNGLCYGFYTYPLDWTNAENCCESTNGHLVSIHDNATNIWLNAFSLADNFWFGLHRNNDGTLNWSSEPHYFDNNGFSNWNVGEPSINGQCAAMLTHLSQDWSRTTGWSMMPCERNLQFICATLSHPDDHCADVFV